MVEQLRAEATELRDAVVEEEANRIRAALKKTCGNVSQAAKALGVPRSRLAMSLAPRGRHAILGAWAATLRARSGWLAPAQRRCVILAA